jgi:hypothetical protein
MSLISTSTGSLSCYVQVMELLVRAAKNRSIGSTKMNGPSSD